MKENLKDKKVLITLLIALLLSGLHLWQYIKSEHEIRALINFVMSVLYIPLMVFVKPESLPFFLTAYSFIYLPFEQFDNYTSLFLICSATSLNKRMAHAFIPYVVETLVVYMFRGMEISHFCIRTLYIVYFWIIYILVRDKNADIKPLDLTIDEEKILEQLCKGKEVKELEWSENTVYKKLREARDRNGCLSNAELKTRFRYRNII